MWPGLYEAHDAAFEGCEVTVPLAICAVDEVLAMGEKRVAKCGHMRLMCGAGGDVVHVEQQTTGIHVAHSHLLILIQA